MITRWLYNKFVSLSSRGKVITVVILALLIYTLIITKP